MKISVPVGLAVLPTTVTFAVKVTDCPKEEPAGSDAVTVVVVLAAETVWVSGPKELAA